MLENLIITKQVFQYTYKKKQSGFLYSPSITTFGMIIQSILSEYIMNIDVVKATISYTWMEIPSAIAEYICINRKYLY